MEALWPFKRQRGVTKEGGGLDEDPELKKAEIQSKKGTNYKGGEQDQRGKQEKRDPERRRLKQIGEPILPLLPSLQKTTQKSVSTETGIKQRNKPRKGAEKSTQKNRTRRVE